MHFAIIVSPVPGHMYPLCALGRELAKRNHRVTVFNIGDAGEFITRQNLEFVQIGKKEFPHGIWHVFWHSAKHGNNLLIELHLLHIHCRIAEVMLAELPPLLISGQVDALLVDHLQFQGASIAEFIGKPFITVCSTLPMHQDPSGNYPPAFSWWTIDKTNVSRFYNRLGHQIMRLLSLPGMRCINRWRKKNGMSLCKRYEDSFSNLAQISVIPREFDYKRPESCDTLFNTGPLLSRYEPHNFPWEKLNGNLLIYISLGTIRNHMKRVFKVLLDICSCFPDYQFVIAKGAWNGDPVSLEAKTDNVIIVDYAPQISLLKIAKLCITHGGAGTVMECITTGTPMIVIPFTEDQPAMAQRVCDFGLGEKISYKKITPAKMKSLIQKVVSLDEYRKNIRNLQFQMSACEGATETVSFIEERLQK